MSHFIYEETRHYGWRGWTCTKEEAGEYIENEENCGYPCVTSNIKLPEEFDVEFGDEFNYEHKSFELNKVDVGVKSGTVTILRLKS